MSTNKVLEYKGFQGSVDFSIEDGVLHGKVLHITDLVTYDADTLPELIKAFEETLEDYIATCKAIGKEPNRPLSGTFNVRIGQVLHMAVAKFSTREGKSINEFVREAIDCHINGRHQEVHHHYPEVQYSGHYTIQKAAKNRNLDIQTSETLQ